MAVLWQENQSMNSRENKITDKERLDYLNNIGTGKLIKQFSQDRGAFWPWTLKEESKSISPEFNDIRDAIDWCINGKNMSDW